VGSGNAGQDLRATAKPILGRPQKTLSLAVDVKVSVSGRRESSKTKILNKIQDPVYCSSPSENGSEMVKVEVETVSGEVEPQVEAEAIAVDRRLVVRLMRTTSRLILGRREREG
jgi:hypothetical protein